ncbi:MAG TPA: type II secretion system F family protein [Caulobacteraceae bacterium]|nr:type II secretion system F family protein [Caulobacteraceae bacterium]
MADGDRLFHYVAIESSGRRVRGSIQARSDGTAFDRLKEEGLSPIRIRAAAGGAAARAARAPRGMSDRQAAELLSDLAALLAAGTDMRTALGVLSARTTDVSVGSMLRAMTQDIGGGVSVEQAFAAQFSRNGPFVAALVASGDMAAGMERAAEMLQSRIKLRDQLITVLSYPAFVLVSTIMAMLVILLTVVPSLAPLVEQGHPPLTLGILIAISDALRSNLAALAVLAAILAGLLVLGGKFGVLARPYERCLLDGPARRTVGGLVYGGFAVALGTMLAAGAPMSEALRLSIRSVRSKLARERLDLAAQAVRQGQTLSSALRAVESFPDTVTRLAAVGEISGALGPMILRAGKIEEEAAIRRMESASRLLGPALIVALGAVIGLMMGGLLTGVTQLGQTAIQ